MSNYDFKNIPVLDDIIELEETDSAEPTAIDALAPDEVDSNFDLFIDDSTEAEIACLIDSARAEISAFNEELSNDYVATVDNDNDIDIYIDDIQSAEPVFNEQAFAQKPTVALTSLDSISSESTPIDFQTDEDNDNEPQLTDDQHPVSLENIVNDMVKQLMPDLEQQLRFLVKQALEDNLPVNIIAQLSDKTDR